MIRIFLGLLLACIGFTSYGQEKTSFSISWDEMNTHLSENDFMYTIEHREITPSLSFIKPIVSVGTYQLMEIDLSVDLRKQHLKNDTPILLLPENKFIQSDYAVAIPSTVKSNARITITGNGGYNSSNTNNGGVKNTAYRDASTYTGIYCPVTGLPLTSRIRN
ncbi:hypothetical protein [uncultured Aquimarina sp.]|uniref:hypothetical protein n=1 Tax=uncultured Aquimarina sp. TaxID=575652 RepID=UPI00263660FF|nr:hypothetical protein [uncultured Aquimarina sp.]